MFGYYKFAVSNAQAARSELAGCRVPQGARAEFSADAIRRDVGQDRMVHGGGFVHRLALVLAASTAFILAGIHSGSARERSDVSAETDGVKSRGIGHAYDKTAANGTNAQQQAQGQDAIAMQSDNGRDAR